MQSLVVVGIAAASPPPHPPLPLPLLSPVYLLYITSLRLYTLYLPTYLPTSDL